MSRSRRWPAREHDARLAAPYAVLGVVVEQDWLIGIDYLPPETPPLPPRLPLAAEACAQLAEYLRDPRFRFDLPIHLSGTPFQRRVWDAVARIPAGETRSYAELARQLHTGARGRRRLRRQPDSAGGAVPSGGGRGRRHRRVHARARRRAARRQALAARP